MWTACLSILLLLLLLSMLEWMCVGGGPVKAGPSICSHRKRSCAEEYIDQILRREFVGWSTVHAIIAVTSTATPCKTTHAVSIVDCSLLIVTEHSEGSSDG